MARLAMPPGHEPIPSAQTSVPLAGMLARPVKTMSRNTVPQRNTSNSGPSGVLRPDSVSDVGAGKLGTCGTPGGGGGDADILPVRAGDDKTKARKSARGCMVLRAGACYLRAVRHRRQVDIVRRLRAGGTVSVEDLARELDVSAATIRRDLQQLDRAGALTRVHGG